MSTFLRLALIMLTGLLVAQPARAAAVCVDSVSELVQAINDFDLQPDGTTHTIKVVQGNYLVGAQLIASPHFAGDREVAFKLLGGYSAGCANRTINPFNTVIDANNQANTALVLHLRGDADAVVEGITMTRFVAQGGGAALQLFHAVTTTEEAIYAVRHCRFTGNSGRQIVRMQGAVLNFSNNLVVNNALSGGGATAVLTEFDFLANTRVSLSNNTVANNSGGQGVVVTTDTRVSERLSEIANNVVWGNGGTDLSLVPSGLAGSPTPLVAANIVGTFAGMSLTLGNLSTNPQFVNAAGGNYALAAGAPGINSGSALQLYGFPARDLTAGTRIIGTLIDRGAFEANTLDQTTFLVTTASDNGSNASPVTGSLRAAIKAANASALPFKINFGISGACPRIVSLAAPMLDITSDVTIDGSTQPGWAENTGYAAFDATLCLVVNGSGSTPWAFHVPSTATNARLVVNGMMFAGFADAAIKLEGGGDHRISGNQFGAVPFTSANNDAIRVTGNAGRAYIGGFDDTAAVNLIAGSSDVGIYLDNAVGGSVLGNNVIGFQADGEGDGGNGIGVFIFNSPNNSLLYNRIGNSLGNGVSISGAPSTGTVLQYNVIGASASLAPAANQGAGVGVLFGARNSQIGAPLNSSFGANLISYNVGSGVWISPSGGVGNRVLVNTMTANGAVDIDLASAGPSANQPSNPVAGPNQLQNFPLLTLATRSTNAANPTAIFNGTLKSAPSSSYRIDIYYSPSCDNTAPVRGRSNIHFGRGTATTNAAGDASFSITLATPTFALGVVSATATSASGDTSEIGNCITEVSSSLPDPLFGNGFE